MIKRYNSEKKYKTNVVEFEMETGEIKHNPTSVTKNEKSPRERNNQSSSCRSKCIGRENKKCIMVKPLLLTAVRVSTERFEITPIVSVLGK